MKRYLVAISLLAALCFAHSVTLGQISNKFFGARLFTSASLPGGIKVIDEPGQGIKLIRVTNRDDGRLPLVAGTGGSSFNLNSTRFFIEIDGVPTLYSFDPSRLTFQKQGPL
ncbi:MAG TPA: hypothetical protein VNO14_05570, partial [Blastocatellia bacterium]|nr:hypothetical protein [Blastocatellia bacterium]